MGTKQCSGCNEVKSLNEFYNYKRNKTDGKQSQCKSCDKATVSERKAKLREKLGNDNYLKYQREIVAKSRSKRGYHRERAYTAARYRATRDLIALHPEEFKNLIDKHVKSIE